MGNFKRKLPREGEDEQLPSGHRDRAGTHPSWLGTRGLQLVINQ